MVNPDGVIAGNYRTSLIGKDPNRLYLQNDPQNPRYSKIDDVLKPEIIAMKKLIEECKSSETKGVLAFIDVHHHSQKRGSFMYGPYHNIISSKHAEVRVLPKIISLMVKDMFRY